MPQPPRYLPSVSFPPYTYVPGLTPHPVSDPQGHTYGEKPSPAAKPQPEAWAESREYLRGIDLFNHGFYWEAHEVWEELWIAAGRRGVVADFLKGLIKLAAAGVKLREGNPRGAMRHLQRSRELFRAVELELGIDDARYFGLALQDLNAYTQQKPAAAISGDDRTPVRVFDFLLLPNADSKRR